MRLKINIYLSLAASSQAENKVSLLTVINEALAVWVRGLACTVGPPVESEGGMWTEAKVKHSVRETHSDSSFQTMKTQ